MKKWCLIAAAALALPMTGMAANGTWLKTSVGTQDYSQVTNWTGGVVASGAGSVATFPEPNVNPKTNTTIIVDAPITIGKLINQYANNYNYIYSGQHPIIFNNGAAKSEITSQGNRTKPEFLAPIQLDNTTLRITRTADSRNCPPVPFKSFGGTGNLEVYLNIPWAARTDLFVHLEFSNVNMSGSLSVEGSPFQNDHKEKVILLTPNTYAGGTFVYSNRVEVAASGGLGTGDIFIGAEGGLILNASAAINENAVLSIGSKAGGAGAMIYGQVNLGPTTAITNTVRVLILDGAKQPSGIYTRLTTPDYFIGNGVLVVLPSKGTLLFMK